MNDNYKDEKTFERWDRWFVFGAALLLGLLASIYF